MYTFYVLSLVAAALAIDIPSNVQSYYDSHRSGNCPNSVSGEFETGGGEGGVVYCQDTSKNVIYLKAGDGLYADMDIDCDGVNSTEGKCSNDGTQQSQTAFKDTVAQYGISDLDAHIHNYVVFGNSGGSPTFEPSQFGIEPLSLMAVVCNNKLIFGIWGDSNGGVVTGEAALSTGQLCFGDDAVSGNNGHTDRDVLYIAFPGEGTLGAGDAAWTAGSKEEFQASLESRGRDLVSRL